MFAIRTYILCALLIALWAPIASAQNARMDDQEVSIQVIGVNNAAQIGFKNTINPTRLDEIDVETDLRNTDTRLVYSPEPDPEHGQDGVLITLMY